MSSLPLTPYLPGLLKTLEQDRRLLLRAEPGTGKTTLLPPAILRAVWRKPADEVWVLEPRRLAAKLAALRVADLVGEPIGESVGYQFRFERVESPRTRLRFLTEGIFLRKLIENPTLSGVDTVILDEFHERSIDTDIALGVLTRLRAGPRPDLRVVVMSATLESDILERYFSRFGAGEVQTQSVPGTRHPIETRYGAKTPSWQELPGAVHRALQSTEGDALIFLPGMAEIRRVEGLLRERGLDPVILHGDLDRREQERALEPSSRRKIILSTNIAESSVTLPGIRVVVDSGLARVARASQAAGFTRLETKRISRASADQRAGRAGRLGPGVCVRLYTEHEYRALRQFEAPEVRRVDLVPAALQLALIGVRKLEDFEWVEAPSADAWRGAGDWLRGIEALKSDGELTTRGRRLAGTPLHPRLALLLEGPREFTRLAARFSEGDFPEGELALDALVNTPTQGNTRRLEERLQASPRPEETGKLSPTSVLVRAFWDRVGRVRGDRVALAGGGELALHREHKLAPRQLLLLLDALERDTGPAVLRSWISLQEEDLWEFAGTLLEDSRTVQWNGEKQRAEVWAELRFGSLALESRMDVPKEEDATALEAVLLKELLKRPEQAVSMDKLRALWARKGFARTGEPPGPLEGAALEGWLRELAVGARSFAEIHDAVEAVTLSPEEASLAPEFVTLPGRAKCPVQYETDRPPWIESRLQDFFGLKEGPRVFRGKVPLTLHLLAPNYRPVQVTRDLSGFWERDYPRVRQELSRRYPRHKWPERPI